MIALAGGLLGGILIALATPPAWQPHALAAVIALSLLAGIMGRRAVAIAMTGGFLLSQLAAERVLRAVHDCDERRLVIARIETIPVPQGAGWQYDASVEPAAQPHYPALRVRVSHPAAVAPRSGERWQLLLQFDGAPAGASADARRRALLRDHVSATARVRPSSLNRRLSPAVPSIDGLRLAVADRIHSRVHDPSAAGLLAALAVGVTGDVSTLQWRVFSVTGITHLVAISGMHVTFFALLCMGMARWLWSRWGGLRAACRRESFAAMVGVVLAFAYALLSGFSVPAQRTAVMLAVFLAARCCGRHVAPLWSVAAALVMVLAFDPMAALSAGFWLSFGAVAAIICIAGGRLHAPGSLRAAALVQWVVTVALLPVTAALFGSFSAVGPLVNAVAIPLFTFALVPPVLVATALYLAPLAVARWCADQLVDLAAWVARQAWPLLARIADLPAAAWTVDASALWLLLSVPAVLGVLGPWPLPLRLGALAVLCSAFPVRSLRPLPGAVDVVMFDVGASRSVMLRTTGHQLLVGTGERFGSAGQRFERVVLPELRRSQAPVVMMLDRADRDSLQALAMARAQLPLQRAVVAAGQSPPQLQHCTDQNWQWDTVPFALRATPQGCWLHVGGAGQLQVAPIRFTPGVAPDPAHAAPGNAALVVLPRGARDAQRVAGQVSPDALMLASLSGAELQSPGWRELRERRAEHGPPLWVTATSGDIRLTLHADGRVRRAPGSRWRAGIWSAAVDGHACRKP